jgi:uncharacterized repeat protein (TIGR03806 family)
VFKGLEIATPVALVQAPKLEGEVSGRWFIADQHGIVRSFLGDAQGEVSKVTTLDLRDRVHQAETLDERGLLGLALHPHYPSDPRLFVSYTKDDGGTVSQVSSFVIAGDQVDPSSEKKLLELQQPYTNHNGGNLAFGPDGLLYLGFGDGGSGGDPQGNGQNLKTWLGKMLRIDVDHPDPGAAYGIPKDNPFGSGQGLPEIYAFGLRNPWRYSFDRETGELWAGDVGQDAWEEIDIIKRGGNYGWNLREAQVCFHATDAGCGEDTIPPIWVYAHPSTTDHRSVTGGFVYRGSELPDLVGTYLFTDFLTGEVWGLKREHDEVKVELLAQANGSISSFAEDQAGELYALDYGAARVLKVTAGDENGKSLPKQISDTGCFDTDNPGRVSANAIPYDVALPFWSDGAVKERYMVLPEGKHLKLLESGDLETPPGTLLIKNFKLLDKLIETRFYVRHSDGEYSGYSYAWREDGKNADLILQTTRRKIGDQEWIFPGLNTCNQCHTAAAGRSLGLELDQLDVKAGKASQLAKLEDAGVLTHADASASHIAFAASDSSLTERARAYLHVNCGGCHRPGGPGRGGLDLRYETALSDTGLCGLASLDKLGTESGAFIAAGKPDESVIVERMSRRDQYGMPPVASNRVDEAGVQLVRGWIESLKACP